MMRADACGVRFFTTMIGARLGYLLLQSSSNGSTTADALYALAGCLNESDLMDQSCDETKLGLKQHLVAPTQKIVLLMEPKVMELWFRWFSEFNWVTFRFHVSFRGCNKHLWKQRLQRWDVMKKVMEHMCFFNVLKEHFWWLTNL